MDGTTIEKVTLTNPIRLVRIYRYCVPYIHQFHKKKVLFRPQAIWLDFDYRQKKVRLCKLFTLPGVRAGCAKKELRAYIEPKCEGW